MLEEMRYPVTRQYCSCWFICPGIAFPICTSRQTTTPAAGAEFDNLLSNVYRGTGLQHLLAALEKTEQGAQRPAVKRKRVNSLIAEHAP